MDIRKGVNSITRYVAGALVFVLVCYAIIVVIGRQALPYLDRYQPEINRFFSQQLDLELSTQHIRGTWTRLAPRLVVEGLCVGKKAGDAASKDAAGAVCIEQINAQLDLPRSIVAGDLIWRSFTVDESQLTLIEDADGHWVVEGLPLLRAAGDDKYLGQLLDHLLLSKHIGVDKLAVGLHFYSGAQAVVNLDHIKLESDGDFHRLTANLAASEHSLSAQLVIEGRGGVGNFRDFAGKGYLQIDHINFNGPFSAIVAQWFPRLVERSGDVELELAAEIWFTIKDGGHLELVGQLRGDQIPLDRFTDLPPLSNLRAQLTGWVSPGESRGLRVQNLDFDWGDVDIKPLNISFHQGAGVNWNEFSLAVNHLNLATLEKFMSEAGLATGTTRQVLAALDPRGNLHNLHMMLDLAEPFPLLSLRTYVDHLEVDSWHRAPAARGLNGYFEWQGSTGFFDLDSPDGFAMHYPGVYENFMEHSSGRGRINIHWQREKAALSIAGGPIRIDGEEGQFGVYLSLDLPLDNSRLPEMYLLVGLRNSHSRYSTQYIPTILSAPLLDWLDRAIGDMDIVEGGFIWRGPLTGKDFTQRSIQLYLRAEHGSLDYDPGWPELTDLSGYITVNDKALNGVFGPAKMGRTHLEKVVVKTKPAESGQLLSVIGDVTTSLSEGAATLLASPLKERVAMLHDWQLQGEAEVKLDLAIPLGGEAARAHYHVDVNTKNGQMKHRTTDLEFYQLQGLVAYRDEKGLYSPGMQGRFLGQEMSATMATNRGETRIEAEGSINMESLPQGIPLLGQRVTGNSDFQAEFSIPAEGGNPHLLFTSTLKGINVELPQPLDKAREQILPLETRINFADKLFVEVQLGERVAAEFELENSQLTRGQITLGGNLPGPPGAAGLTIVGRTPAIALDEWLAVYQSSLSSNELVMAKLELQFAVNIGELSYHGFTVDDAHVTGRYDDEGMDVSVDSESLSGKINMPVDEDDPIKVRLNYVVLPQPDFSNDESFVDQLDLTAFPHVDFSTEGLRIGDKQLGSVGFLMQPLVDGVELTNLHGEITGMEIKGLPDGGPATLTWRNINGQHSSSFVGALETYDLGAVLKAWQMPMLLNSKKAVSMVEFSWQDKPWDLSINTLSGQAILNFKDGSFFQAPGATTNAFIKVISLINFDTWLRRLRLDFSDLFSADIRYDSLTGGLKFKQGIMAFDAPIEVDLSAGKLRLKGQADMLNETIDAHLVATLPVATNLPWIVALVGGLPAAAGVYLTSKVFEKTVDNVSSLSYIVRGPWSDPEVKVDRIFSDKTED
ncbi:MAG: TIGR02099 family protein [Gammaproteobacteria bacterium]|nr:MAG: TIGR02099 family protein [Gammaproteobacteria bacterium]RLA53024.1 MAG: TIGR02099 family protein [Gammaproteobacteria bacterium]